MHQETVQIYGIEFIKPHPKNNEYFDDISGKEYEDFKSSIQNEGVLTPLIVSPDMTLISGHQRLKVCQELGWTEVPIIIRQDIKTEEDKLTALLASNFGRMSNNKDKRDKVILEYYKLCGNKQGERGHNVPLREIAKQHNIDEKTIKRIIERDKKLTTEMKEFIDKGHISKTMASNMLVKLSKEEQIDLLETFGQEIIEGVTQKQMQEYVNKIKGLESKLDSYEKGSAAPSVQEHLDDLEETKEKLEQKIRDTFEDNQQLRKKLREYEQKFEKLAKGEQTKYDNKDDYDEEEDDDAWDNDISEEDYEDEDESDRNDDEYEEDEETELSEDIIDTVDINEIEKICDIFIEDISYATNDVVNIQTRETKRRCKDAIKRVVRTAQRIFELLR